MTVAVLEFQSVEACPVGSLGRPYEVPYEGVHIGACCLARHRAPLVPRRRGGGDRRPVGVGRRTAAGVGELDAQAGVELAVDEVGDAPPGSLLFVGVQAGATRGGAPGGADGGHSGEHETAAAEGLGAQVDEIEVARDPLACGVQRDGRYDDPVAQEQSADPEGAEHGRHGRGGVDGGGELLVAHAQVVVGDAAAAGEKVEGELRGLLRRVAADVLEPFEAGLGGALGGFDDRPAFALVRGERRVHVGVFVQAGGQREGVLHGQLGAGADGEVGGVGGVAEQDDVAVAPGGVADGREAYPLRGVGDQAVAVEVAGQDLLAPPHARLVALTPGELPVGEGFEARPPPVLLRDLHDESAALVVVGVGVDLDAAEVPLLDDEGERLEDAVGGQPHVAAVALVQVGAEAVGICLAGRGADSVRGDHEVVAGGELLDGRRLGPVVHLHPELRAAPLQDLAQPVAVQGGEAVAA